MANDFLCPYCKGFLNIKEDVVFLIKKPKWDGGLIMLSPELGNYTSKHHRSFKIEEGENFDFLCPICHAKLVSEVAEHLAGVIMRDKDGEESRVLFSRINGEQSTYKITDGKKVQSYGEHAKKYIDYVNLSMTR